MIVKSADKSELPNKDPAALLRQLVKVALVSIVVILSLAASGIYAVYSRQVNAGAELDAVKIGSVLLALERDSLLFDAGEEGSRIAVDAGQFPLLDRRIRQFLHPFDIVKIKIFAADCRIVYSTDPTIIGRVDAENMRLQRALAGQIDSRLEKKEEVLDLVDERKFSADVVETYLPILDEQGSVIGSFELYVDVTAARRDIARTVKLSVSMLALVLIFVFACAFVPVERGTRQLKEAQAFLQTLATTDALTGLLNRYQIFLRAEQEFARLRRETGHPEGALGVLMVDVDHFKRHNDAYGHQAGDLILKEIADRIVNSLRRYDCVGRYGGEEFLVVLPGTGFEGARTIAERIRQRVESTPVLIAGAEVSVTVSIGLACTLGDGEIFEGILRRADLGLYRAKSEGRNRVAWIDGEEAVRLVERK